jgi:hypothetical protein
LQFTLLAFHQEGVLRRFTFQGIDPEAGKRTFTVEVDQTLGTKHRIPIQEYPILCRRLLEATNLAGPKQHFSFSEADMLAYRNVRDTATREAEKKRTQRRTQVSDRTGNAWRSTQPVLRTT